MVALPVTLPPAPPPWRRRFRAVAAGFAAAFPYLAAALFATALTLVTMRHEMWRDEIQAWLLARDSASLPALFLNLRYEGHPGLWHLLLWPLAHLTWNPAAMQGLHIALATASAFLVLRFAPFPRIIRLSLVFGYLFFYEWGVIARNYAVSVLILFAFCALFPQRRRLFPVLALLLAVLCHANVHSVILVIALGGYLALEHVTANWGRLRTPEAHSRRFLAGSLILAIGITTAILQLKPPADANFANGWNSHWNTQDAKRCTETVINGWLPLPENSPYYWNSNQIRNQLPAFSGKRTIWQEARVRVAVGILAFALLFFLSRPLFMLPFLAGTVGLELFFYIKYPGSLRHHGFLFLWFVVLLWLSACGPRRLLPWRIPEAVLNGWHRFRFWLLLPLLALQVWGAWIAARQDWNVPFSNGPAAAARIRREVEGDRLQVLAGESSPEISTVVGYARLPRVYYLDRESPGSFIVWDNARTQNRPRLTQRLRTILQQDPRDALLLTSGPLNPKRMDGLDLTILETFKTPSVSGENYYLYRLRNPYAPATLPPAP